MLIESRHMVQAGNMHRTEWTFKCEQKRVFRSMQDGTVRREKDQHMSVCVEVDILRYQARWHRRK